jgi:hypothetical protein
MSQNNYSLGQLQAMTAEELIAAFPQKRERWVTAGYKVDFSRLITAIILATKDLHLPITKGRGCREVWYNPVKPILSKVERNRVEDHKYMALFEQTLSKMVKKGVLTYADLGIDDFRTLKETFDIEQKKAQCWSNILLFIEKDGAYVHLTPLKELFNINIISGAGWSNTSGIERLLRTLAEKGISEVVVFTLTDYDPFGFAIDHEFVSKCEVLGLEVAEHHRIGINVEHATPEILDVQKYPIKHGKLSVEGVCFDSDKWLADYGIEGKYGLEIEAISAQPATAKQPEGHQFLREIVAKELLEYLNESDRIDEITTDAWKNAPYQALWSLMYSIDGNGLEKDEIEELPKELPKEYLSFNGYNRLAEPIYDEMESKTSDIDEEIDDLESQLDHLNEQKDEIEQPFKQHIKELQERYFQSRRVLTYCLWQQYQKTKGKWTRGNYDLGFPEGCLLNAIKEQKDLNTFLRQLNSKPLTNDLESAFLESANGKTIAEMISNILKHNGEKPPH